MIFVKTLFSISLRFVITLLHVLFLLSINEKLVLNTKSYIMFLILSNIQENATHRLVSIDCDIVISLS